MVYFDFENIYCYSIRDNIKNTEWKNVKWSVQNFWLWKLWLLSRRLNTSATVWVGFDKVCCCLSCLCFFLCLLVYNWLLHFLSGGPVRLHREVVLLTDDRNLRVKALTRNVPVRDIPAFLSWAKVGWMKCIDVLM